MNCQEDLHDLVLEKVSYGEALLNSLESYKQIEGIQKLGRKISQELKFLKKISKLGTMKIEHLQCSNLTHFSSLISTLDNVQKCICVNKVFTVEDRKITIDIIGDDGSTWIKVIARNHKSLSQVCNGDASYGVRSVVDQAEDYVQCSKLYPCLFQTPKIIFVFANGVGSRVASKIESLGVQVKGTRIKESAHQDDSETDESNDVKIPNIHHSDLSTPNISHITTVNLDVSAMLAYVSSVTNGSAHLYNFSVRVLAQQAEWERERPQKPILESFFAGKKLYCCQTAMDNFVNIVKTVGGPSEKIRADELIQRITVLPDDATLDNNDNKVPRNVQFTSDKKLSVNGKIKERSLVIFIFGDRIGAVTVSANDGFVRSAKQQGINFVVFIHESRALTEQKEVSKGLDTS